MTPALYFHPEAYTTSGPKLMGRHAAGESFLRGLLAHASNETWWLQVEQREHAQAFAHTAKAAGRSEPVVAVDKAALARLREPGLVYHPGPGIGEHAWQRRAFGDAAWSLCGITHTTASARAMDAITDLLTAPVQPWDAVICTSEAVRDNVQRLLQAQADHLNQRLGVTRLVLPRFPVIPLGIHTGDFAFSDKQRRAARKKLEANTRTHVVVFLGRLSFHAKAHPLAMYQALERAAQALPRNEKIVLVECGWHANEFIAKAFADAAQAACPSVRVVTLDGRDAAQRETAWAGADVFCSLSDNIQETFGIAPIEAMAAGLPVVVSDWDGYKDTVRDGVDGFRIPTLLPPAGTGADLALRHALEIDTYDVYCGHACSFAAVDIEATAHAFSRLFASPELRREMGAAGRARAREVYDWSRIIPRYEALWQELAELRAAGPVPQPLAHPWPARMDPFAAFSNYPTHSLSPDNVLELASSGANTDLEMWKSLAMINFAKSVLPDSALQQSIIEYLRSGPQLAKSLLHNLPPAQTGLALRAIVWMMKLGIITSSSTTSRT